MTRGKWLELEQRAKTKAFTVAGVMHLDLIQTIFDSIQKAIEEGLAYGEWAKKLAPDVLGAWEKETPTRLTVVFRTNIQAAYGAGRIQQLTDPDVLVARPYWLFDAVMDSRVSSVCRHLNGVVRPADDPWWQNHQPPLHFNCRSTIRSLSPSQAQNRGITEKGPDIVPQEGFGNASESWVWQPDSKQYDPSLWGAYLDR